MSPDAMLRLAKLLEEAAKALRSAAIVMKDLQPKIVDPTPISIRDHMSVRSQKALHQLNITELAELEEVSGDQILACKNTGISTLSEIREIMARHGLSLLGESKKEPEGSD